MSERNCNLFYIQLTGVRGVSIYTVLILHDTHPLCKSRNGCGRTCIFKLGNKVLPNRID